MLIGVAVFFWRLATRPMTLLQAIDYCRVEALGTMQAIIILVFESLLVAVTQIPRAIFVYSNQSRINPTRTNHFLSFCLFLPIFPNKRNFSSYPCLFVSLSYGSFGRGLV